MIIKTRIEIILDADVEYMYDLQRQVERHLQSISNLYDTYGVWNVKINSMGFNKEKLMWVEK